MKNKNIAIAAVVVILSSGVSFYAGTKYRSSTSPQTTFSGRNGAFVRQGAGQQAGGRQIIRGRPIIGEVISQDEGGVTIKLPDGSSKIVAMSAKTTISKTTNTTKDELQPGAKVAAFGIENPDGSVTADNIQLNPMFEAQTGGRIGTTPTVAP